MIGSVPSPEVSEELREELERLTRLYRHLHEEHRRAPAGGRVRRRLERRLHVVAARYERRLRGLSEAERAQWVERLDGAPPLTTAARARPAPPPSVAVATSGVGDRSRTQLRDALAQLAARAPRRPLFVRGTLRRDANRSVERPARASAVIDLGGRVARAHAEARTPVEAIDLLIRQLHRQLREQARRATAERRHAESLPEP